MLGSIPFDRDSIKCRGDDEEGALVRLLMASA